MLSKRIVGLLVAGVMVLGVAGSAFSATKKKTVVTTETAPAVVVTTPAEVPPNTTGSPMIVDETVPATTATQTTTVTTTASPDAVVVEPAPAAAVVETTTTTTTETMAPLEPGAIPRNLDEAFVVLQKTMVPKELEDFQKTPENKVMETSFYLENMIRNNWINPSGSPLREFFNGKGLYRPEGITQVLIISFHRSLNKQPLDVEGQIKEFKAKLEAAQTPPQEKPAKKAK